LAGIRRDLERRLARAEIDKSAIAWADRAAAHHREALRARVKFCRHISERLRTIGINPELATTLRRGDEALSELSAIPDTDELRSADEAIIRDDLGDSEEGRRLFVALIERMTTQCRRGGQPDFATAPPVVLFAFCIAAEERER
jgi:hypothetical protein